MLDRTTTPAIHDAIEFDYRLPPINKKILANGLPVYWLAAGVQDVVQIDWVFPAGIWQEQKNAVAHAVAALLRNGTNEHTADQINETLEFYGAHLKTSASNDYATVTLHSLTKHLANLLPIIYELITDAVFPEYEVELYKNNSIQKLLVNLRKSEFVANQRIDAMLFGENYPYGRFTKKEDLEVISREDLLTFYKEHYDLSGAQIFVAGNVGSNEISEINNVFGRCNIHKKDLQKSEFIIVPSENKKQRIINDTNGLQGAVRIGRLFPTRHHPDYAPMVVLNTLFGGYFGSRLMSNIREDKGYTYGIHSSVTPEMYSGSLVIHTETGRDVAEDAIKEVYKEMELLCKEPAEIEELLLVKNYLLGNLLGDLDGPFSILRRWRTIILNGFGESYFNDNVRTYKSVTPEELQRLAQKYFNPDDFHEVVVI